MTYQILKQVRWEGRCGGITLVRAREGGTTKCLKIFSNNDLLSLYTSTSAFPASPWAYSGKPALWESYPYDPWRQSITFVHNHNIRRSSFHLQSLLVFVLEYKVRNILGNPSVRSTSTFYHYVTFAQKTGWTGRPVFIEFLSRLSCQFFLLDSLLGLIVGNNV